MKKNSTFSKVILGILEVILGISFICMVSGYYEFTTFNKVTLWIWFITFIINYLLKIINQFKEMKLINICRKRFLSLQKQSTLLNELKPYLDDSVFQERKKHFLEWCQQGIEFINLVLEQKILKKHNQEYLEDLLKKMNELSSSV